MYKKHKKRIMDILLSLVGIIILLPVFFITAIAIKIESSGPIVFKQKRLGRYGKEFDIYKFRSMCNDAEKMGSGQYSFKGDSRVTRVGRIIRATSIDELPQFFNILKGDMSLIGFRPPLTYHPWPISDYTEHQMKMFNERPGVTGWAQIHGRKTIQWDERIELGIWYAENISFYLDMKIIFLTIVNIIKNKDNENTVMTVERRKND